MFESIVGHVFHLGCLRSSNFLGALELEPTVDTSSNAATLQPSIGNPYSGNQRYNCECGSPSYHAVSGLVARPSRRHV